jgi:hypothetical protein
VRRASEDVGLEIHVRPRAEEDLRRGVGVAWGEQERVGLPPRSNQLWAGVTGSICTR